MNNYSTMQNITPIDQLPELEDLERGNSMIPEFIRLACNDKFGRITDFDVPDICGKMEHTRIYIRPTHIGHSHSPLPNSNP